jgi:hypothetical protein
MLWLWNQSNAWFTFQDLIDGLGEQSNLFGDNEFLLDDFDSRGLLRFFRWFLDDC